MTKRKIALAYVVYAIAILWAFAPMMGEAVSKIQVNTDSAQIISNKTLDSSNTYNGGTFNSQTLTSPTLATPTWSSGAFTLTPLNANSLPYLNASKQLSSTANPTNGQLLIGSTGTIPALGTLTGTANQVTVTNGAGSITLGTPQSIGAGSSPTFVGLTLSGLSPSTLVTTNGSNALTSIAGPIGVSAGGLGISTTPNNGFVPIGNGSSYTAAALTAGGGIGIANASGSITVSSTSRSYLSGLTTDTGVVDALCSTSASSPILPTGYTKSRRIGSGLTNGSAQWVLFSQQGNEFLWSAAVLDVNSTNPTTSAVSSTLSVPPGVKVFAIVNQSLTTGAGGASACLLSALDQADAAVSTSSLPLADIYAPASGVAANRLEVRTNTTAQIRRRCSFSDANVIHRIATLGWIDTRGRDS